MIAMEIDPSAAADNTHDISRTNGNSSSSSRNPQAASITLEMNSKEIESSGLQSTPEVEVRGMETFPDTDYDKDVTCGLCSIRCPSFVESKFANKKTFLIIFCITSILQGMYQTYFVSILTTIEKLYQIQSKTIGIIMSATEISQIIGSLFLTYYAGQGNRPKWIGIGILVFAVSSLLTSTPHFIFNHRSYNELLNQPLPLSTEDSSANRQFTTSNGNWNGSNDETSKGSRKLCLLNNSSMALFSVASCSEDQSTRTQSDVTTVVLIIFFLSRFMIGIGATALNTLGISFLDDNVAPKESPLYFGITIGVRIFGPVFGFLLGSVCTSIYVDFPLDSSHGLDPSHPDWIGAWWLGALVVGFSLLVISIPMLSFPKRLPSPDPNSYCHKQMHNARNIKDNDVKVVDQQEQKLLASKEKVIAETKNGTDSELHQIKDLNTRRNGHQNNNVNKNSDGISHQVQSPSIKNFPAAVKRLLRNEILLLRTASSLLHILPIAGLYTFLPKYLESQFQVTASTASVISGLAGILVMGVGIFSSAIFMRKYKPSVRFVAAWIAATALLYAIGMVLLMTVGCPTNNIVGLQMRRAEVNTRIDPGGVHPWMPDESANPHELCQSACSCSKTDFAPICTTKGDTLISPCIAGCLKSNRVNATSNVIYSNCKCLDRGVTAVNGFCDKKCSNLIWYIVIFSFFVLIHSTSEVGSMLLTLRCVEPQDKSMALGLIAVAVGLFGNVPCSIIYGAVVDSTCLFWESNCDSIGACRFYDSVKFRLSFHGLTAFIMLLAFIVDIVVWFKSSHIKLDEGGGEEEIKDGNHRPAEDEE